MAAISWFSALRIDNSRKRKGFKRFWLVFGVGLQLALLGYFKYAGFILGNIQRLTGVPDVVPEIVLPIGISFYTFQLISYVVDVYWENVKAQKNYLLVLLYCSLFHQCIAGPIVRYKDVAYEIEHRKATIPEIGRGINRFTIGLFKKAVLANSCAQIADTFLPEGIMNLKSVPALGLWLGVLMYMLQIYLDFSAYSDMAIGMGLMVGFHFKENFNYPYIANSVTDFWRRWHISLSTFFRDYVYIPLGGNRKGKTRTYVNLLIVWFLTGLWHGASWNFVLWGLFFCTFLFIEKAGFSKLLKNAPKFVGVIYTLIVVYFGWILFRFSDFRFIPVVLKGLLGLNNNGFLDFETKALLNSNIVFIVIAIVSVTPVTKKLKEFIISKCDTHKKQTAFEIASIVIPVILLILSTLTLVGDSYNPFLYFQF